MLAYEHIHVDPAYAEALAAAGLDRVRTALDRVDGATVAWSRTTDTLFIAGRAHEPGFYLKRYYYPSWRKRLRSAFRGTLLGRHRGQAEFELLTQMRELGTPTVRPVAYGSRRVGPLLAACFLITEEAPGAQNLTTFASDVLAGRQRLSSPQRRTMLARLAREIARLHDTQFSHGQLYWRNILVRIDPNNEPEYFFLDPRPGRGLRTTRRRPTWWIDELAQVSASAESFTSAGERMNFLLEYLAARRLDLSPRRLLRKITRRARLWQAHERQRLRMSELFTAWSRRLERESADDDERSPLGDPPRPAASGAES